MGVLNYRNYSRLWAVYGKSVPGYSTPKKNSECVADGDGLSAAAGGDAPRRIVFLDHTAALGGGEIALLNLVQQFNTDRYLPIVVLFADGPLAGALKAAGIQMHLLPLDTAVASARKDTLGPGAWLHLKRLWVSVCFVFSLARLLRSLRPDFVHTNSLKSDILGGFAARLARVPVIWHIRDRIEEDYLPAFTVRLFRFLSRWVPDFIIANSAATLDTLCLNLRRSGSVLYSGIDVRARVVHDGTEPDTPAVARPERPDHAPLVGLVGRISPWKGQHIFLQAAAMVRERFPAARFQIVGAALFAEEAYEAEVHALVEKLHLGDIVEFTGFRKDVPELVANFDILVHASTTGEPFGQVVIEGMAAAKPVIATHGGGIPEIVIDGVTGLLVPMGDVGAMAAAICRLLENPGLARRMGQHGRRRALEHFTIEHTAEQAQGLYDELLARKSSTARPADFRGSMGKTLRPSRRRFVPYVIASVLAVGAYGLAQYFNLTLGNHGPKFPVFFAAILVSAWFGSIGPGIAAMVISLFGAAMVLPPSDSLGIQQEDVPAFIFFAVVSLLTLVLIEQLHIARRQAELLQRQAENSQIRASFLARATATLAASPDDESILMDLAHLAVPFLADWVILDRVDGAGNVNREVVLHQDSAKAVLANQLYDQAPTLVGAGPIAAVLRTGVVKKCIHPLDASGNGRICERPGLMESLGAASCVIVPLIVRSRTLGAMTLMRSCAGRPFALEDVNVATELASRTALALEDAAVSVDGGRASGRGRWRVARASEASASTADTKG